MAINANKKSGVKHRRRLAVNFDQLLQPSRPPNVMTFIAFGSCCNKRYGLGSVRPKYTITRKGLNFDQRGHYAYLIG